MLLSPYLIQLLESYDLERLQTLLQWLESASSAQPQQSLPQEKEPFPMSALTSDHSNLDSMDSPTAALDDLVIFSILEEFGPQFMGKTSFQWLSRCVSQRYTIRANAS